MTAASVIRLALIGLLIAPAGVLAQTAEPAPQLKAPTPLIEPALSADVEFARSIAIIRADLLMADALVKERDWVDARPHANFPREEIYGAIRGDLHTYKTPQFDGALRDLAHAVASRNVTLYERAAAKVQAAHDAADVYDDAVANGRIVRAVGYQSARGIVLETERMIDGVAKDLAARNPDAAASIRGNLMRLKDVFASVAAPKEPRADVETVRSLVAQTTAQMRGVK